MSSSDEEVVDPAMERVRRKLVRLLFVSSGVMVIGFAAVLVAVIYRATKDDAPVVSAPAAPLAVAPGDIVSATAADNTLVLVIAGASPRIEVRAIADGALVQTFPLAQPATAQTDASPP